MEGLGIILEFRHSQFACKTAGFKTIQQLLLKKQPKPNYAYDKLINKKSLPY
tara:strand:+ start:100 stop:255 length:156 start_codon:yes stop_codon:yes gene_type:complete